MTTYKDIRITGDGEVKEISRDEWIELFRDAMASKNDVTIFGYVDSDGWTVLWQGPKNEMRFKSETLINIANFASNPNKESRGEKE